MNEIKPALVVLAAGMGSRFGGLKQLEGVGPGGETLMDYSIHDAVRAGFGRVIFIIRRDIEAAFRERVGAKYASRIPVAYAFQALGDLPEGFTPPAERTKPWGTGQAVLAAAFEVREPFAVINADDFYGAAAYRSLATFLMERASADRVREADECALVAYPLRATLSEFGTVSRGVCEVDASGHLTSITERTGVERTEAGARCPDGAGGWLPLRGDSPVSMNFWGFRPSAFGLLREAFEHFLRTSAGSLTAEFYLPSAVNALMQSGRMRTRVLSGGDTWCGVTYREDKPHVEARIRALIDAGAYPRVLSW
ncbi:MAG: hypothetical protein FLDDKLPJ_01147 [Phycisphaerae bacterium]|nr:hypothetical protein [Phycisphaerae bacterium]